MSRVCYDLCCDLSVVTTVAKGTVLSGVVNARVVWGASSHVLLGGIAGTVVAKTGAERDPVSHLETVAFTLAFPLLCFYLVRRNSCQCR